MEELLKFFPIVLYALGSILLIVLIILGIKLIHTVNRANSIIDDAYNKMNSLNGVFRAIDKVTDAISNASDNLIYGITNFLGNLVNKNRKNKRRKEVSEEDE